MWTWFFSSCVARLRRRRLIRLAGHVGLAEPVAAIRDGELTIRSNRSSKRVPLALRGLFEIRNLVRRGVVGRVLVQQRQMPLPDAFGARKLGVSQISDPLV